MLSNWGALVVLMCLAASSCNGQDSGAQVEPADTTTTPLDTAKAVPESTSAVERKTFELPPVDDETATATLQALERAELTAWIERAQVAAGATDPPCDPSVIMLTSDQFNAVVTLADEVTGELLANLDASLGAAAEWCRLNDLDAAQAELSDAAATAVVLEQRLGELDR